MSSSGPYVPVATPAPLSVGMPPKQKKLSHTSVTGTAFTLIIGGTAFALAVASLSLSKKAYHMRKVEFSYTSYDCYSPHRKLANYLDVISTLATFTTATIASVFGGCPCCCSIRDYKKNLAYSFSIIFLVLTWLCFFLVLLFEAFQLGTNIYPEGCDGIHPEQLLVVILTGFFGAGHILTSQLSWMRPLEPSVGVPVPLALADVPMAFARGDTTTAV